MKPVKIEGTYEHQGRRFYGWAQRDESGSGFHVEVSGDGIRPQAWHITGRPNRLGMGLITKAIYAAIKEAET